MRISIFAAVLLAAGGALAAPASVQRIAAGSDGFIDDGYALRDDGKAIAYITTDGATTATLHLADVGGNDVKVAGAPTDVLAVAWLAPARGLVLRRRGGAWTAQVFTAAGPDKAKPIGPFARYAFATVDGK